MIRNYFKIAIRNIMRHKGYAAINILGLTLSIASATLLYLFVDYEQSFDSFHSKSDRTFRLIETVEAEGEIRHLATTAPPVGQAMVDEYPSVLYSTRIYSRGHLDFLVNGERIMEREFYMADSTFFDVFDFEVLAGDPYSALKFGQSVVLTRSLANRFFGDIDVVGNSLTQPNGNELVVRAVLEDIPPNSHLQFNLLLSLDYGDEGTNNYLQRWDVGQTQTYIVLDDAAGEGSLTSQLPAFFELHFGQQERQFYLQPMEDIYLESGEIANLTFQPKGNKFYIQLFIAIAIFMLIISCINYMNLATAKSMERAKEIGLRKVSGALRSQLVVQMMSESLITAFIAFGLAVGVVDLMIPFFNEITGKAFEFSLISLQKILPVMATFTVFVGFASGSYPALMLSNLPPATVLRGELKTSQRGIWLRQGLVITQFTLSIFMIIATLVVFSQMDYVRNKSLGFNQENLVVVDINNGNVRAQWETVRHEFSTIPGVSNVSSVSRVPGEWKALISTDLVSPQNRSDTTEAYFTCFDENTVDVFGMKILAGKNFKSGASDTSKLLVNQAMVNHMGWDNPIGQQLMLDGVPYAFAVIGVVEDFHFQSLHDEIQPMVIGAGNNAVMVLDYFVLKTSGGEMAAILDGIANVHNKFDERTSVEIHFLDEQLDRFYKSDVQAGQLFAFVTGLTIFISCLGLFGLIAFFAQMKTKEVSVRKVLGASSFQLVVILSRSFLFQVAMGFVIAAPAAWYLMSGWLDTYSYRISMPIGVFFAAGLLAISVTILTISYQAIKTSRVNPATSLKQE